MRAHTRRKICIVSSTRADWGLLGPVAQRLQQVEGVELQVVATNMHLLKEHGETWREIEADGVPVSWRVPMEAPTPAQGLALCTAGMGEAFAALRPDMVVILGDRYEMLAVASVATVMGIPIAHLHGGEITEGAIDNNIRHALTKLAALHLTAAEPYRLRVIQMGEEPQRVWNVGAMGVYNALHIKPLPLEDLAKDLGMTPDRDTILATFHPATLDPGDPRQQLAALLQALDRLMAERPEVKVVFTHPNNDPGSEHLADDIRQWTAQYPQRALEVASLGRVRYMSLLRHVGLVVGNSSSGIIEVPSMHIPTLDIGSRQRGRLRSESITHCEGETDKIYENMQRLLSSQERKRCAKLSNPYSRPYTLGKIVSILTQTPLEGLMVKHFHYIDDND